MPVRLGQEQAEAKNGVTSGSVTRNGMSRRTHRLPDMDTTGHAGDDTPAPTITEKHAMSCANILPSKANHHRMSW